MALSKRMVAADSFSVVSEPAASVVVVVVSSAVSSLPHAPAVATSATSPNAAKSCRVLVI